MDLLSYIYPGDFNITRGSDTTLYGYGNLNVSNNVTIYATTASINASTGALFVHGGAGIIGNANIQADLNVIYGTTSLAIVDINTNLGPTTITGRYPIQATVGSGITFISTGGNIKLSTESSIGNIVLESYGSGTDAVSLTSYSGGTIITAQETLELQSANQIDIGTDTSGVPVNIGTSTSTTTINGNLNVKGTTTTIDSVTVTFEDNILLVNDGPSVISDGGLAIKRYQPANNADGGSVITDTPIESGTVGTLSNTATTINLSPIANATDDYYNNWWIHLVSGTGAMQVRRIKDYNGTTNIATIYATADQTNQIPTEGLNFLVVPDDTTTYDLYYHSYKMFIWDESNKEFALTSSAAAPGTTVNVDYYCDLHLRTLTATNIIASTINNLATDTVITFTLTDNSTTPVTITSFPSTYGIFRVLIRPQTNTDGAYTSMILGRSNQASYPGTSVRDLQVPGANGEKLFIRWQSGGVKPEALYRPSKGIPGTTVYTMKITTV